MRGKFSSLKNHILKDKKIKRRVLLMWNHADLLQKVVKMHFQVTGNEVAAIKRKKEKDNA